MRKIYVFVRVRKKQWEGGKYFSYFGVKFLHMKIVYIHHLTTFISFYFISEPFLYNFFHTRSLTHIAHASNVVLWLENEQCRKIYSCLYAHYRIVVIKHIAHIIWGHNITPLCIGLRVCAHTCTIYVIK
jgi:hypothetical protein